MVQCELTFWGVRGSHPVPGHTTQKIGGNTSCIEINFDECSIILDMGSGAKALGDAILALPKLDRTTHYHILFSHYHWDHIIGIPFFRPFFNSQFKFDLYGPSVDGTSSPIKSMEHLMSAPYFPITPELFNATFNEHLIHENHSFTLEKSEIQVDTIALNHAPGTIGYRLSNGEKSIVYASDMEHPSGNFEDTLVNFATNVDVLVYDAMYTNNQYYSETDPKTGWGHSTWQKACELATLAGVKHLVLFHHNPLHSDKDLTDILNQAKSHFSSVSLAIEGSTLSV